MSDDTPVAAHDQAVTNRYLVRNVMYVDSSPPSPNCPLAVFEYCPQCGYNMTPEHAHYRCTRCGWRDGCCW